MRVVVLGAGVVGTASAWYLARAGHEVTVVDRQGAPALETSFANGGQVSVSHAEPWANPEAPALLLKWLGREDAPLLFRPRADWAQWSWGMRFLLECLPQRARANTATILALALYSRAELQSLRTELGLSYDQQTRGILHLFSDRRSFDRAATHLDAMRSRGLDVAAKSTAECVAIEPTLADARELIAGGTYTPSDESGDARLFTAVLAAHAAQAGVRFRYDTAVELIDAEGDRVASIGIRNDDGSDERLRADAYVVALGSYSPLLLKPLGLTIPVYPVKGYSITIPLRPDDPAPSVSLTDESHKIVISRLGQRLRVAGTAELNGYNTELNAARIDALVVRAAALFPRIGRRDDVTVPWTGLRPATPSNVPLIGRTRFSNLFLNTGHGTLGWTLACGSGRALADLVSGRQPEVGFRFLGDGGVRTPRIAVTPSPGASTSPRSQ